MTQNEKVLLPDPSQYVSFFEKFRSEGKVAEIEINVPPLELVKGEGTYKWVGEKEWPVVLGYPFYTQTKVYAYDNKTLMDIRKDLINPGFDIIVLYWSNEYQGFVCVRGDNYEKR